VEASRAIDLRSDTVTRPSPGMREAIAGAVVGDDVFEDDPTVKALERKVASLLGKDAGLFVPSGTMGNQIALRTHTSPGDEVVADRGCHCVNNETGAAAALAGVQFRTIDGRRGHPTLEQVKEAVRPREIHLPRTGVIVMENTHNMAGGTVYPIEEMTKIGAFARDAGVAVHLDGARLFNASAASGVPVDRYASCADSAMVCMSKGLGAPIGSVLTGTSAFIAKARRFRKMYGGAMRQVGILAAASLYALEHNLPKLAEDHEKAKLLAEELASSRGMEVDPEAVESNILMIRVKGPAGAGAYIEPLAKRGVLILDLGPRLLRAVTHLDLSRDDVVKAARIMREVIG
jgi:threonine aldolase